MARKFTETETNVWFGHMLFAHLIGHKECDCEECKQLREDIAKGIKKVES